MAITKRREAQMTATRAAILGSAREIAREQGWAAVTIRRIAEMIDYSAPIIYEYFQNKEAILTELQRQGFAELEDRMRQASASGEGDAAEALLSVGDAYLLFAEEEPEVYQIMHGLSSAAVPLETSFKNATGAGNAGAEALRHWQTSAGVPQEHFDLAGAGETFWALLHGLASLAMLGRLEGDRGRARRLARTAIAGLLRAWTFGC